MDELHDLQGRDSDERGSALILAILVLVLLASSGIALLYLSQTEQRMSVASLRTKQAFYLAEAGIEDGRMTLLATNGGGTFNDDLDAAAGGDNTVSLDASTLSPIYDGAGNVTGFNGVGDDVPVRALSAFGTGSGPGWYAAFLTNDPVELPGSPLFDNNGRVMITAIGVGDDRAVEVAQAIIEPVNLLPLIPPATIMLLGPTPVFDGGNSNASGYSGNDCGGTGGIPDYYVPVVGTIGSSAEASAEDDLGNPTYESGDYENEDTISDLTDPSDPYTPGTVDPAWTDCQALHDMIEALRDEAHWVCSSSCGTLPATTGSSVSFIDTTVTLGPGHIGSGLLVVTGRLRLNGGSSFDGLIMVIGQGEIERSGGGGGDYSGSTIVADIAGPNNVYGDGDDCSGGPNNDGFGIASYTVSGGGNSQVEYCTDALTDVNPVTTYRVVEFLQR
jgi:hypothetical protein